MSNTAQTKTAEVSAQSRSSAKISGTEISIRVPPNGYFAALFVMTFFSAFLIYLSENWIGGAILCLSWIVFPLLAWTDKISFDGKKLIRTGFVPKIWARLNSAKYSLKLSDVEQVETHALRALKRGGNVFYRYRTSVQGKDLKFTFASGGEEYRRLIHKFLPLLSENTLDNRSIELRDYLSEPKETLMKAQFAKIPSAEVLEDSLNNFQNKNKLSANSEREIGDEDLEKVENLRRLANELRLSGYLLQALEAFRRALVIKPKDAWLLFEFARCLHSLAGAERDPKLHRKSIALLRLAEKRGQDDNLFLSRLGESYFQFGNAERARKVFQKSLETAESSFRSIRGLAEIALREGKIAHVIHHFGTAYHLAETPALRRWTKNENEYFRRLNNDDEYMELEISRVNMLENLENSKKTSLKIALFGIPLIILGLVFEEQLVTNVGWAVSCVAILIWSGLIMSRNLLASRVPLDLEFEEE